MVFSSAQILSNITATLPFLRTETLGLTCHSTERNIFSFDDTTHNIPVNGYGHVRLLPPLDFFYPKLGISRHPIHAKCDSNIIAQEDN